MARKKNLERAIILGLILSTGVYGSAWAATVNPIQNSNYNNYDNAGNPFSESVIVNANTDGEKDSIGNIVLRNENNYNVIISTNNGNIEFKENSGSGILLADGIKTGTTVTINASGEISINAGYGIQGNAKDREDGNVSKISLTAKNNKITTSNIGIYSTGGVDVLLNAESNEIISDGKYGIQATESSDGKLNLIATNGNNTVKAENGTAIRANGEKVITLDASGNNIVIGGIYGIENTETNQFIKTHNKIYTDLDAVNNIIYGTDTAIKSDGLGITDIKADQNNNIGFLTNDKGEITDIAQTGINVTEGTVNVTAGGSNIIKATDTGIYAENSSSKVYLNSIENNIISVNNSGNLPHESGAIGLYAADGARIINDDNKITGRVEVDAETINGNAFGLQARENGEINFKTNDLEIRAVHSGQAGGETVGIYAGYGVTSSTQEQTSKSNIEIVSEGGIEINALQNGSKVNTGAMAYGVKGNNAGSITLTAKNNDVNIFAGQLENTESITNNSFGVAAYNNSDVTINTEVGSINIITGVTYDENGKAIIDGANNQGVYVNGLEKGQAATAQVTLDSKNDINIITASKSQGTQHGAIFVAGNGIADIDAGNNITLNASNESSSGKTYGVSIASVNDKIYLDAGGTIDIDVSSGQAIGVSAQKGTAELNAKNVEINSYGKSNSTSAQGIASGSGAKLYLGAISDIAISAQGNAYATGIYTNGNNSYTEIESDKLKVLADNLGKGFGSSNAAYGIWGKDDNKTQITTNNGTYFGINTSADGYAAANNGYGIYAEKGAHVDINSTAGNNIINVGVFVDEENQTIKVKENGIQAGIKASGTATARTNVEVEAVKGINSIRGTVGIEVSNSNVDLIAGNSNLIYAGDTFNGFGRSYAVNASSGSTVILSAGNANDVYGAVYANGTGKDEEGNDVPTTVTLDSANNIVKSYAIITGAGDLDQDETGEMKDAKVISALYAEEGASINVTGENYIRTYAVSDDPDLERVVWAYKDADINIDGATIIKTDNYEKATNSKDIAIAAGTAVNLDYDTVIKPVDLEDRATVNINYENYSNGFTSYISGDILSAYEGLININAKEGSNAGINITGNLLAGNNGILNVDLGKGGVLLGRADDYGDAGVVNNGQAGEGNEHQEFFDPAFSSTIHKGGRVDLGMGAGSTWFVTGQSWITTIDTTKAKGDAENERAKVDLVTEYKDKDGSDIAAHALTVYEFKGDADFLMSLSGNRADTDMLYMKHADGNYRIMLDKDITTSDINQDYATGENYSGLRFATVGADSDVTFTVGSYDNGGAFNVEYEVGQDVYGSDETAHENEAYNGSKLDGGKPGDDMVDNFFGNNGAPVSDETGNEGAISTASANSIMLMSEEPETLAEETQANDTNAYYAINHKIIAVKGTELNDTGKTILNMSRANYSNAIYMDRLNKRLGEARYINSEEDEGMWVRIRHDRIGKDDAYRSQNTMYELGYDQKQECDNGERRVGMAIDYMHGDTGYDQIAGKGEIDRYGLWLYDTWMGDKGHYADYVAKWGHLSNDFEVYTMQNGDKVTGDYSNNVFSVSAEYGRKKDIGNDWYFEPQVQAQLARVMGADYTTNQGTKVSVDGINSLIGRAGFRLGKDFGEEKQSTVYIKADVLHEFLGDQDVRVLDKSSDNKWAGISYENEGTWYDVGFGFATQMSKNSYAFMDFEKSFGNDNDETYQINVGMQWSF